MDQQPYIERRGNLPPQGKIPPFRFINLDDACVVTGLAAERLLELTQAGYAPHWRVDGGAPLFDKSEISRWVKNNFLQHEGGRPLHRAIIVHVVDLACQREVPTALLGVRPLFPAPT